MDKSSMKKILESQETALKILADKMEGFYLVGGTALSRGYFHHRKSYDLDFFAKEYLPDKIDEAIRFISSRMRKTIKKSVDSNAKGKSRLLRMRRYEIPLGTGEPLKIDFVKDPVDLLQPFKRIDGIDFASLDDIYLRKLYTVTGFITGNDKIGRIRTKGKRQEARDLFDLYHLSKTYKPLAAFAGNYPRRIQIPAILQWYHSLSKSEMDLGLGDIVTTRPLEFTEISRHFKKEVEALMKEITE